MYSTNCKYSLSKKLNLSSLKQNTTNSFFHFSHLESDQGNRKTRFVSFSHVCHLRDLKNLLHQPWAHINLVSNSPASKSRGRNSWKDGFFDRYRYVSSWSNLRTSFWSLAAIPAWSWDITGAKEHSWQSICLWFCLDGFFAGFRTCGCPQSAASRRQADLREDVFQCQQVFGLSIRYVIHTRHDKSHNGHFFKIPRLLTSLAASCPFAFRWWF